MSCVWARAGRTFLIMRARSEGNDAAMTRPLTHQPSLNSSQADLNWETKSMMESNITKKMLYKSNGSQILCTFYQISVLIALDY